MKKLTLLVLSLLFLLMMVSCVDYSTMRTLSAAPAEPEASASAEPMVRQSAYEALMEDYNALNEQLSQLAQQQETESLAAEETMVENTELNAVVSDVTLSVYRSVISKETLGAFFGMITAAEKLGNGDVVLTVQPLTMVNESVDALLYDEDVIKQIYTGLTLEATNEPVKTFTITESTMVAYNGETHLSRDIGFYTYVIDEMTSAKAIYDAQGEARPNLLPGPVFIFLALDNDVVMALEK